MVHFRRGQWDSTSATANLLVSACMTDIVLDELGHVTICMCKMNFSSYQNLSVNKLLQGAPMSACWRHLELFFKKMLVENFRLSPPLNTEITKLCNLAVTPVASTEGRSGTRVPCGGPKTTAQNTEQGFC